MSRRTGPADMLLDIIKIITITIIGFILIKAILSLF